MRVVAAATFVADTSKLLALAQAESGVEFLIRERLPEHGVFDDGQDLEDEQQEQTQHEQAAAAPANDLSSLAGLWASFHTASTPGQSVSLAPRPDSRSVAWIGGSSLT